MSAKHTRHVCWDIQLASELIVVQVKSGQLDEVAELLGQFTYKTWWKCQITHKHMYAGTYNRTCQLVPPEAKRSQIDQLPKFDRNSSCDLRKVEVKFRCICCYVWDIQLC